MNRGQVQRYRLPGIAAVLAHPQRSRRRSEGEHFAAVVDVERVPVHEIVRVLLRQACRQRLERLASIVRAIHDDAAVGRTPFLIHAPPVDTPITMSSESRGFTQMEWRPVYSAPPPLHCPR